MYTLPAEYAHWEAFRKSPAFAHYRERILELAGPAPAGEGEDAFIQDNYLSNELRIPVTLVGTRAPGSARSIPEPGDPIDLVFGRAWQTTQQGWPRTREQVAATSVLLRGHLLSELDSALSQTRRSLPGPLPAGQSEDDPDTGLVEHGNEHPA